MYAEGSSENAQNFNCVQRGHQNTLEALPLFLISQLLLASLYPLTAAGTIAFWTVGRIIYFLGYAKGDPNKRLPGAIICNLTQLGSWLALAYIGGRAFFKL
jgi:glutathione S-transferase